MHEHVPINQFSTDTKNTQYYLKKKELNCDTLLTNQINCIYYKSTYNVCTHTNTRIQRHPYVCTISIAVCACIARRLLLDVGALRFCFAFGCPANKIQNTKKKLYFFSLPRSFLLAALYLFGFSACGLVSVSLSPLLLLALCTFMLLLYLLFRCPPYQLSLSRTLLPPFSRSLRRLHCLSLFIERTTALPFAPHRHKNTSLFFTTPLSSSLTLSPHSLDDLHDDATYNSNRLKRKTNKNELNRKA